MIEFVNIKNFKSFRNASFPLGDLNVFTGLNGVGKSTFIQSLLLLRQSYEKNFIHEGLVLNGSYVRIGTGLNALHYGSDEDELSFVLNESGTVFKFSYQYNQDSDFLALSEAIPSEVLNGLSKYSLFNRNFKYLCAGRIVPSNLTPMSDLQVKYYNSIGINGEFTAHYIAEHGSRDIPISALKHPKATSLSLISNINAWLTDVSPNVIIKAECSVVAQMASLGFAVEFNNGTKRTDYYPAENVGFGISFVLPVLVTVLTASKDDLIIIENPETHIHPAAQAMIGRLCAVAANHGVQIVIETHSDHIFNGVRVAVKNKIIGSENVAVFFMDREADRPTCDSVIFSPKIDENGFVDYWPENFFDQWEKHLDELL